jgi:hypothetical protein
MNMTVQSSKIKNTVGPYMRFIVTQWKSNQDKAQKPCDSETMIYLVWIIKWKLTSEDVAVYAPIAYFSYLNSMCSPTLLG